MGGTWRGKEEDRWKGKIKGVQTRVK